MAKANESTETISMEYHEPAGQWEAYGMNDFSSYCAKSVVKGLFHPLVPTDVVEAFQVAEYMMAHAYYHYPLYDEAFSKMLRILEMAVRIRCKAIGIDVTTTRLVKSKKNPKEKIPEVVDKTYNILINELSEKEPRKEIREGLHWLRETRNSYMHTDHHGYMGSMTRDLIKVGVTLLNKIFISEQTLVSYKNHLTTLQERLLQFNQLPSIFIGRGYLVEGVEVKDVILLDGIWLYFVIIHPITINIAKQIERHEVVPPETFIIDKFSLDDENLTMREMGTGKDIVCSRTSKPENVRTYEQFILERNKATARIIYYSPMGATPKGQQNEFLYNHLWKVS